MIKCEPKKKDPTLLNVFLLQEYLSEYHYDEPIDKDKERQLMSFGDDYRNFLGSLSESQGSIGGWTGNNTSKKKSKRLSKKKLVSGQ